MILLVTLDSDVICDLNNYSRNLSAKREISLGKNRRYFFTQANATLKQGNFKNILSAEYSLLIAIIKHVSIGLKIVNDKIQRRMTQLIVIYYDTTRFILNASYSALNKPLEFL